MTTTADDNGCVVIRFYTRPTDDVDVMVEKAAPVSIWLMSPTIYYINSILSTVAQSIYSVIMQQTCVYSSALLTRRYAF